MAEHPVVALLSLEPWDEVWRRNQYLAAELTRSGAARELLWISPPRGGLSPRAVTSSPMPGVTVIVAPLVVPRRWGGHVVLGRWLRRRLRSVDVLWINDPVAGRFALRPGMRAVYDVTDDWRSMPQPSRERARTVAAEDDLAHRVATVVCSDVLASRWRSRYGVDAPVVPNGVDLAAIRSAHARALPGSPPHAVYVGTLHDNRLDLDLVESVARSAGVTVHLVGPDHLSEAWRGRLRAAGVRLHGPVAGDQVPGWLVGADVLICPHLVDQFTLSLDAIKAYEYLATDRPVVATPSSGFQALSADALTVVEATGFVEALRSAIVVGPHPRPDPPSWSDRAGQFAQLLLTAKAVPR